MSDEQIRDDQLSRIRIDQKAFQHLLEDKKELIQNAQIFMDYIFSFMPEKNFVIVLTDEKANILKVAGGQTLMQLCNDEMRFLEGTCWMKEGVGKTAISEAINTGMPAKLCGEDHPMSVHQSWSCYAAPIVDADGMLQGVLCLTENTRQENPNALGMVIASAKGIENQIKNMDKAIKLKEQLKYQSAIVENMSDGFLTIDQYGKLTYINRKGAELLALDQHTCIGKHVGDLVPFKPIILEVLETGKGYTDREYVLENLKGKKMHLLKTAMPIKDEQGELVGVIDIFKEIKQIKKMINSMVGAQATFSFGDILGNSQALRECIQKSKVAAQSLSSVLIQGESGTGKELFAHAIHRESQRSEGPFVAINCAAIPKELIESELFGYAAGAFTGGVKGGRPGKFELAHGGTIFLDEIGDMPLNIQAKLLRVLQDKKIVRVGGDTVFDVDVRIVAATNRSLYNDCTKGLFRWDIYYRLNVLSIQLPPLRERECDVRLLADFFVQKIAGREQKNIQGIDTRVYEMLKGHHWPGNVRELENVMEQAVNLCDAEQILPEHLPAFITRESAPVEAKPDLNFYLRPLEDVEKETILKALAYTNGNVSRTAKLLNVSRNTLYNKMQKYDAVSTVNAGE
ncbi:sigma-54 interaction domain-containing protein [Anoxynatronum buryatiense]|uniref:PAS domain S-box-containing protein n=1 Tax=Anoxynatronum buryatiense TaxID=489973 RepID=A0AA46AJH6_9CLOT|nr:sigma 54-interacting transcriptional regulator [Anoxynatronum buryatiense]SMP60370.1 PAS domain S-box-containing protein [Anoxynatronum buryatiense]